MSLTASFLISIFLLGALMGALLTLTAQGIAHLIEEYRSKKQQPRDIILPAAEPQEWVDIGPCLDELRKHENQVFHSLVQTVDSILAGEGKEKAIDSIHRQCKEQ